MYLAAAALICWLAAARAQPAVNAAPPAPPLDALQITGYSNVKTAEKVTEDGYSITVIRPTDGRVGGLVDHLLHLLRTYTPPHPHPAPPAPTATEHGRHCNETTHASTANTSYITNPIHNFNASKSPLSNATIECYQTDTAADLTGNKSSTPFSNDSHCISSIPVTNILKDTYSTKALESSRPWYMPPLEDSDYYYAADCDQVRCMADNSVRVLIARDNITCGAELSRILNGSSEAVMIIIKTDKNNDQIKPMIEYLKREPLLAQLPFPSVENLVTKHMKHRITMTKMWLYDDSYFVTPTLFARVLCDTAAQPDYIESTYIYYLIDEFLKSHKSNNTNLCTITRLQNEFKELFIHRTKYVLKLRQMLISSGHDAFWQYFPSEIETLFTGQYFRIYNSDKTGVLALTDDRDNFYIQCGSNTTRDLWRTTDMSSSFYLVNQPDYYVNLNENGKVEILRRKSSMNWSLNVADGLSADGNPLFCFTHSVYLNGYGSVLLNHTLMSNSCRSGSAFAPVEVNETQRCDPNSAWMIVQ